MDGTDKAIAGIFVAIVLIIAITIMTITSIAYNRGEAISLAAIEAGLQQCEGKSFSRNWQEECK